MRGLLADAPRFLFGGAVLFGLLFGVVAGLFSGASSEHRLVDDWEEFPDLTVAGVESRVKEVAVSPQWRRADVAAESEAVLEVAGKPGVFAYLKLVAIVNEPEVAAIFRSETLPDKLAGELLVSLDGKGLARVSEGEMMAAGWRLTGVAETGVTVTREADGHVVNYKLFEW
jgi:hypothetical protein